MINLKKLVTTTACILLIAAIVSAQEQTPSASKSTITVTATAGVDRVRFTAPSLVVQMRIEVYGANGAKLFDNEIRGGNVIDWHLQDGQAEHLSDGSYLCVVTTKSLSGRLSQKLGRVTIDNAVAGVQSIDTAQLTAQQAQAVGPLEENASLTVLKDDETQTPTVIAHNGTEGQITRGRGALSFRIGDFYSGKDVEQMRLTAEGNLGIGITHPQVRLDVDGLIRASQGLVFPDGTIQYSAASKTLGAKSSRAGQMPDGKKEVRPQSTTATQDRIAKFTDGAGTLGDSIITESNNNIGIGITNPVKKLHVAGGQIAIDNQRFYYSRRTNGNFQEAFGMDSNDDIVFNRNAIVPGVDGDAPKAPAALIFGTGAGKFMDVRNSSNVTMLRVQEATGSVGIGTTSPAGLLHVKGASPVRILGDTTTLSGNESVDFMARSSTFSSDLGGMRIQRQNSGNVDTILLAAASGTSASEKMRISGNGNVSIGGPRVESFSGRLDVQTTGGTAISGLVDFGAGIGVFGLSRSGAGVVGVSASNLFEGRRPSTGLPLKFRVRDDGQVRSDVGFTTPAADFAELMEADESASAQAETSQPGDVLVISPETGKLRKSNQPYSTLVAGIYSTKPGFLGNQGIEDVNPAQMVPVALVGVVPTKVSAENGAIHPGDLLTTSRTPGHAMKASPVIIKGVKFYRSGTILGKALEPLKNGRGVIKVLVMLR